MSHRTRFRLPVSRRRQGGGNESFWWLALLFLGLIAGSWIWWWTQQNDVAEAQKPSIALKPIAPAPVVVAQRTNAVTVAAPPPQLVLKPVPAPAPTPVPVTLAGEFPRAPRDLLEAQIALARRAISSGSIDGVAGGQTRAALVAFQGQAALASSGELDPATRAALALETAPLMTYRVTSEDIARLQPLSKTWLGKSQQTALDYETILELVAERGRASPNLVRRLNPAIDWTNLVAGTEISIPNIEYPAPSGKAAFILISLAKKHLQAFDGDTNLLAHFPCSIAARFDKRPVGELRVTAIAPNPDYTFNPEVFPESEEARHLSGKLILPPGPNNPVGTAWLSLDKPGYGLHGTPSPEQVGRTESHGCFRLANWNAEYLIKLAWVGLPVRVTP